MKGISILSVGRLVEYLVAFFSGDKRLLLTEKAVAGSQYVRAGSLSPQVHKGDTHGWEGSCPRSGLQYRGGPQGHGPSMQQILQREAKKPPSFPSVP